ncbi:helix-turn-helix domain-containing protein [Helicobacter brantae]|uniref:Transcriptional regulator n=1 Tax=Helicobacter brantae TaxID=375927 RepID=A0A3D8IZ95_9HELI|nr:helix-turn-helix transcriptional regulator [Helicobacter brantae]RDU70588.1 transcriptional regulator [Helicobacter brantae]
MKEAMVKPIKFDKEEMLKNAEVERAYKEQSPFWELQRMLIEKRRSAKLTQEEIAQKMGVRQSAIARFESVGYENCTLSTLVAYAKAIGMKKLIITL